MCGIAGIWNLDKKPIREEDLTRFSGTLAHRGPDSHDIFIDSGDALGLGHHRLAILDLSDNGKQPMPYENGRYRIVHNGEIYNFIEIRESLKKIGYDFHTQTDTEVILAAYARWGPRCQFIFNGMWAFAIWDSLKKVLFLSRDRFGIKPLYFYATKQRFAFASEMKAFLELSEFEKKADFDAINIALANNWDMEYQERCLLRGARRLLAGHSATVTRDKLRIERWWNTLEHLPEIPRDYETQTEKFRYLFEDACRLRTRSDVPVISCLSGGLDSSSIVGTIAAKRNSWIPSPTEPKERFQGAFTMTFPNLPNDERVFADLVASNSNIPSYYFSIAGDIDSESIERILWDCEDIFFNFPLAIWLTYQEVRRQGFRVTLDGHGGDELLAGYPQHIKAGLVKNSGLLHPFNAISLCRIWRGLYGHSSQWPRENIIGLLSRATPGLAWVYNFARRVSKLPRKLRNSISGAPEEKWLKNNSALDATLTERFPEVRRMDDFSRALYEDFHATVLPTLLRVFDRASMAHGVEVRMPFLDWRLVTFSFALPMESKLGEGFNKRILRSATYGIIPERIRLRKDKVGFASPMQKLFKKELCDWINATINSSTFLDCDLWDGRAIRDFCLKRGQSGGWDYHSAEKVWPYLNAAKWIDIFVNNPNKGR